MAEKSNPLGFFASFSETAWNFNIKFYTFIQHFHLHLSAKLNLTHFYEVEITEFLA